MDIESFERALNLLTKKIGSPTNVQKLRATPTDAQFRRLLWNIAEQVSKTNVQVSGGESFAKSAELRIVVDPKNKKNEQ